jgi:hypothetical protein
MATEPSYLQPLKGPVTFVSYKTEPVGNALSQALYINASYLKHEDMTRYCQLSKLRID